jgi:hypothetical protein
MRLPRRSMPPTPVGESAMVEELLHGATRAHSDAGQWGHSWLAAFVQVGESLSGGARWDATKGPLCIADAP